MSQTPLGRTGVTGSHELGPARRRIARLVWVGAAALIVILAVGGYLAAGIALGAADRQAADVVLEKAITDNNQIARAMPTGQTSVDGSRAPAQAKATMDGLASAYKQARATVASDLPRLRQASATLRDQSHSLLVVPQRRSLDDERARVDAVVVAYLAAGDLFQVASDQMGAYSSIFDAVMALGSLVPTINSQDVHGALAAFPDLKAKVKQAATLSKGRNVAPQMRTLIDTLATFVTDLELLLQSDQAGDVSAVEALSTRVQADSDAIGRFDQTGFDTYESTLFKPYEDRYVAALTRAGFKVTM